MTKNIGTLISLALSGILFFGCGDLHWFAFYVILSLNVLAWLLVPFEICSAELRDSIRSAGLLRRLVVAGISIASLVATGHPALAASQLLLLGVLTGVASISVKKEEVPHD